MRAPLLWVLLVWVAGQWLAGAAPCEPESMALAGLGAGTAGGVLAMANRAVLVSRLLVLSGAVAGFWALGSLRGKEPEPPPWLPAPRETEMRLRFLEPSPREDPYGRISGIAVVEKAAPPLGRWVGSKVHVAVRERTLDRLPASGFVVEVTGVLREMEAGPSEFNRSLRESGVHGRLRQVWRYRTLREDTGWQRHRRLAAAAVEGWLRHASEPLHRAEADVLVAMLLGKKAAMEPAMRARFAQTGTLHLFAVSGMHVLAMATALGVLLGLARLPPPLYRGFLLAALGLYVWVTGAPPSALRAYLMVVLHLCAGLFGRQACAMAAWAGSAVVALAMDPYDLGRPGFQLSYVVVGMILLYGLPLQRKVPGSPWWRRGTPEAHLRIWERWGWRVTALLAKSGAISLSATLGGGLLVAGWFGWITPVGLVLNLVLVPLAGLIVGTGFVSILAGLVGWDWLLAVFNHGAWQMVAAMDAVTRCAQSWPGGAWPVDPDPPWGMAGSLTLLGVTLASQSGQVRPWLRWGGPCFLVAGGWVLFSLPNVAPVILG